VPVAGPPLGFPVFATKNTTRVAGGDAIADAAGVALATYPARTAESRPQGTASVHVFTPTLAEHGWSAGGHSVAEVVTDDMPFLVDSVVMELTRQQRDVHLVVHPQFDVTRDLTGRLESIACPDNEAASPPDYVCIQAFIDPVREAELEPLVDRASQTGCVVTHGLGPRYLHSTGQLHKGGPPEGRFVQVVDDSGDELAIPDRPFGFGKLIRAQADGDLASLRERGRPIVRVNLEEV